MHKQVPLYLNGEFVPSSSKKYLDVKNPATQETLSQVPCALESEMEKAVEAAQEAFKSWRNTPVPERVRYFLKYQELLKQNKDEIAKVLCMESGKNFVDGQGDVWRGIEVVEHACSAPSFLMGETVENVARKIDSYSYIQPLGVCAGITPFNFPAMIPLWLFPLAIVSGNTFILKPSPHDPLTPTMLGELLHECKIPPGVFNIVHGEKEQVDFLLDHPAVKAISFIGSVPVAQYIYRRGCENNKRVQSMAGAKNHLVAMPDADPNHLISALASSSCGAAGQRCMAISVAVMVGEAQNIIPQIKDAMAQLTPGYWEQNESSYGPLISPEAKERVEKLIAKGVKEGAQLLLDGRGIKVSGFEKGNFIGPTLFDHVTPEMSIYQEEIFGPVLSIVRVPDLDSALQVINNNSMGNGTSIFTRSGASARKFRNEVEVGQVGINIPIPVALPFFSFTGWKNSFYGDLHSLGKQAFRFYTETKTVTARFFEDEQVKMNMTIDLK
ncbi:MAG: CoA-acylating methylmalonate-semialdehyde dehydrogenase [Halobacteriovoraceae bacterium]|nr:CoA-acylating methylmalonate-semialdehyde dehydrogenase [Halobacteriovoraceae bacterium]